MLFCGSQSYFKCCLYIFNASVKPQCVGIRYKTHILDVLKKKKYFSCLVFCFALPVWHLIRHAFNAAFLGMRGELWRNLPVAWTCILWNSKEIHNADYSCLHLLGLVLGKEKEILILIDFLSIPDRHSVLCWRYGIAELKLYSK